MSHLLTLNLPEEAYAELLRSAIRKGRSPEDTAAEILADNLTDRHRDSSDTQLEGFRKWQAPCQDREDIGDSSEYVDQLRRDDRLDRLYSA